MSGRRAPDFSLDAALAQSLAARASGGYKTLSDIGVPRPIAGFGFVRYRDADTPLLLLTALMPQRWFYDTLILWLIPKSRRAILWTALFSWGPGVWRWYYAPQSITEVGRFAVIFIYLPMLAVILIRQFFRPEN